MAKVEISREFIGEAMRHKAVRAHLRVIANRVEQRARVLAASAGSDMTTRVEDSIRPGGRPQSVVWGDDAAQEFGDSRNARLRILGRAAQAVAK